jgi:hypothetical protein
VLAHVYVPILEFGVLGFLNRTYGLPYNEAFLLLRREYLPAFQQTWNSLARRLSVYRMAFFRRCSVRLANRLLGPIRRFIATLPGRT